MAVFFSAHTIHGMSKAAMRERAEKLVAASTDEPVELLRAVCDVQVGRMVCEWVAPNREAVFDFLKQYDLELRGEDEWLIHVDVEEPPATPPVNLDAPD